MAPAGDQAAIGENKRGMALMAAPKRKRQGRLTDRQKTLGRCDDSRRIRDNYRHAVEARARLDIVQVTAAAGLR